MREIAENEGRFAQIARLEMKAVCEA